MSYNYGVQKGQFYVAADGSQTGVLVLDDTTFIDCDDVVVQSYNQNGTVGEPARIDTFKLAMVRYSKVDMMPEWASNVPQGLSTI